MTVLSIHALGDNSRRWRDGDKTASTGTCGSAAMPRRVPESAGDIFGARHAHIKYLADA
jgi:hypothetical protein